MLFERGLKGGVEVGYVGRVTVGVVSLWAEGRAHSCPSVFQVSVLHDPSGQGRLGLGAVKGDWGDD